MGQIWNESKNTRLFGISYIFALRLVFKRAIIHHTILINLNIFILF